MGNQGLIVHYGAKRKPQIEAKPSAFLRIRKPGFYSVQYRWPLHGACNHNPNWFLEVSPTNKNWTNANKNINILDRFRGIKELWSMWELLEMYIAFRMQNIVQILWEKQGRKPNTFSFSFFVSVNFWAFVFESPRGRGHQVSPEYPYRLRDKSP